MVRFNPSPLSYADAGGARQEGPDFVGPTQSSIVVNDGGGTDWEVRADGSVKAVRSSTFPEVVGVLQPAGASKTKQILANLSAASSSNARQIEALLGTSATSALPPARFETVAKAPVQGQSLPAEKPSLTSAGAIGTEPTPLTERLWFWPVVILGSTVVLGGGIWAYSRFKKKKASTRASD